MNWKLLALCLAVWGAMACGAHAQAIRCTGPDGKVTYSDRPCESGGAQRRVKIVDNSSDSSELRARGAADREQAKFARTRPDVDSPTARGGSQLDDRQYTDGECRARRRDYEVEASSIKPNLRAMADKKQLAEESCQRAVRSEQGHTKAQADAEERERRRQQALRNRPPPGPVDLMNCDRGGCWGTNGQRYESLGGGTFTAGGRTCTRAGSQLICP